MIFHGSFSRHQRLRSRTRGKRSGRLERTAHHPVDGILVSEEHVDIYVHQNVPGITADKVTTRGLRRFPYLRQPPSRLVRYRVPKATWSRWTDVALSGLS